MKTDLRSGFTTGTCAAAAARAAAFLFYTGQPLKRTAIRTPSGKEAEMAVEAWKKRGDFVGCAVRKDAGDDPDVTNGSMIWAFIKPLGNPEAEKSSWYEEEDFPGVFLTGGQGVGLVTKPGLSCPVGKHAINPVPRKMIIKEVYQVKEEMEGQGKVLVQIEIPEGRALAEKTFNPRLGIEGGLSVLGTTGIVEPMSEEALTASIELEIHMKAAEGRGYLILSPGNYGQDFLKEEMGIPLEESVKCSNFIAFSVRAAAREGFTRGLLAGHVGKLIKVAGGVENTHSKYGDGRMEILAACLKEYQGDAPGSAGRISRILACNTTEEALEVLSEWGLMEKVGEAAANKVRRRILDWTNGRLSMDVVIFSSGQGIFGKAGDTFK